MADGITIFHVFIAALITAIATGFGAIPFLFVKNFDNKWLGIGNSIAAGLMLGASIGLVYEGVYLENVEMRIMKVIAGLLLGGILVLLSHYFLERTDKDYSIGQVTGANAVKMLMIVGIMTVHSFAEGIGVGVSFGDSASFGSFISIAIAIHNIPEGLAISLVLIPRGTSVRNSTLWSIFSSLPQPIMAVPAFLFVLAFKTYLPVGLGVAAGAMFWMVFRELIPDALKELSRKNVYALTAVTAIAMIIFQLLIET
ncbi:ZIP family metal transporter [Rhodohalobacter sp. 614A]|uniref:ZIP family metal transporter n=1 Tax=Rhodohalobacter sp. 614A TaxID=2908649 RepID=UPI00351D37E1